MRGNQPSANAKQRRSDRPTMRYYRFKAQRRKGTKESRRETAEQPRDIARGATAQQSPQSNHAAGSVEQPRSETRNGTHNASFRHAARNATCAAEAAA